MESIKQIKNLQNQNSPSIFDVTAQETLKNSLFSAYKHCLLFLSEKFPRISWIENHIAKSFFILNVSIEWYFLKYYSASFSENFYNMKRILMNSNASSVPKLSHFTVIKSLITISVIPLFKMWLDEKYIKLKDSNFSSIEENYNTLKQCLKSLFMKLWPLLHLISQFVSLFHYIRFITGQQKVHSQLMKWAGVHLSYLTEDDFKYFEKINESIDFKNIRYFSNFIKWFRNKLSVSFQHGLQISAFLLQFLDFFYSSDAYSRSVDFKQIPDPPHLKNQYVNTKNVIRNACPLCKGEIKQATVLSVSGLAFCYRCILVHVKNEGKCPVTDYPATVNNVVRLHL